MSINTDPNYDIFAGMFNGIPPSVYGSFPWNTGANTTHIAAKTDVLGIEELRNRVAELELKVAQLITILDYITGIKDAKGTSDVLQEGGDKV